MPHGGTDARRATPPQPANLATANLATPNHAAPATQQPLAANRPQLAPRRPHPRDVVCPEGTERRESKHGAQHWVGCLGSQALCRSVIDARGIPRPVGTCLSQNQHHGPDDVWLDGRKLVEWDWTRGELRHRREWHFEGQPYFDGDFREARVAPGARAWDRHGMPIDASKTFVFTMRAAREGAPCVYTRCAPGLLCTRAHLCEATADRRWLDSG